MITEIQQPQGYETQPDTFFFLCSQDYKLMITEISSGIGAISSPHVLIIGESYQECVDYINEKMILPQQWMTL